MYVSTSVVRTNKKAVAPFCQAWPKLPMDVDKHFLLDLVVLKDHFSVPQQFHCSWEQVMRFLNKFASVEVGKAPVLSYFILVLKMGQVRELHLFMQPHVVCWQVPGLLLLCADRRLVTGRRMAAFHRASVHILSVERK